MRFPLLCLFILGFSLSGFAADEKPMDPVMMAKWKEFSTPGENHKVLTKMAGRWSYTSKWWKEEGGKPEESKGMSTLRMIMGGRFLMHETKGMAMGKPFEGMGIMGYDNLKKKFDTIWFDNMGTGVVIGKGDFNPSTQTLMDEGEFSCPMTKDNKTTYRGEWKMVDNSTMIYSMFGKGMSGEGNEFKTMEMVFKRK